MNGIHETAHWRSRAHRVRSIGKDEAGFGASHLAIIVIIHPISVSLKEEKLIWAMISDLGPPLPRLLVLGLW